MAHKPKDKKPVTKRSAGWCVATPESVAAHMKAVEERNILDTQMILMQEVLKACSPKLREKIREYLNYNAALDEAANA
jgi:hypothetical protein